MQVFMKNISSSSSSLLSTFGIATRQKSDEKYTYVCIHIYVYMYHALRSKEQPDLLVSYFFKICWTKVCESSFSLRFSRRLSAILLWASTAATAAISLSSAAKRTKATGRERSRERDRESTIERARRESAIESECQRQVEIERELLSRVNELIFAREQGFAPVLPCVCVCPCQRIFFFLNLKVRI